MFSENDKMWLWDTALDSRKNRIKFLWKMVFLSSLYVPVCIKNPSVYGGSWVQTLILNYLVDIGKGLVFNQLFWQISTPTFFPLLHCVMEIRVFRLLNIEFRESLPISFFFPHFFFPFPLLVSHITHTDRVTKDRHDIFINPNNGKCVTEKIHS